MKYNVKATAKQKKAVVALAESGGKISISEAMRQAGYSPATNTPQKLTESEGFKALAREYGLSEVNIIEPLKRGLEAKAQYYDKKQGKLVQSDLPDNTAIPKFLGLTAKILGVGEINKTHSESKSINIDLKGSDTNENILANLIFQANRTKDLKAQA